MPPSITMPLSSGRSVDSEPSGERMSPKASDQNVRRVAPPGSTIDNAVARTNVMRNTDHGGGPADDARNSAVSATPDWSRPRPARRDPTLGHLRDRCRVGDLAASPSTTRWIPPWRRQVCSADHGEVLRFAGAVAGLEPEGTVDPQRADAGDMRSPVAVDRCQPAGVSIRAASARALTEPHVQAGRDGPPVQRREVVQLGEVLGVHARTTLRGPKQIST